MRVVVVPPNAGWPAEFTTEAGCLLEALAKNVVNIHHIGSTAIPGIFAKPVIDILLVVRDLRILDDSPPVIERLGYEIMGEFGIPGRRYFRKDSAEGVRTHQVHAFQVGSAEIDRHLAFRDYMRSNLSASASYSNLKRQLAAQYPDDLSAYMDGKDAFIKEHEARALRWARQERRLTPRSTGPATAIAVIPG
ncbi:GrpB family protein [Lacipirellula limnantheis]|uniref:Dephospho-CoA kinase/protein folding accessory domain-containing protein n=1 Tax=Lacipirellula limnantheis TaxID=2528024 RepID=A0A517TTK6_9BACT|nr:GrpB family protein [Lacipirellula limnantheis]QDT71708.1 dephospho-CoA kinase/protein folding accessory domain-containing protein [Lacipirellula limnantheis]